ncbi:unnamed protein product [Toxocara canis]|uniref:Uncharacterized protein n=1 Tax=Toxocara canis TaxID=6265 RepID=A0A3P7F6K8_TOXCA|nr:unnamed protein product [Toxocara canis]
MQCPLLRDEEDCKNRIRCAWNGYWQELLNNVWDTESVYADHCLVYYEYADRDRLRTSAMNKTFNVFDGVNVIRTNGAYGSFRDQNCRYMEFLVLDETLENIGCSNERWPNTQYLPWTLFVCKCNTSGCDAELSNNIEAQETAYYAKPLEEEYHSECAVFNDVTTVSEIVRSATVVGRDSFVCFISAVLKGNKIEYNGGIATRELVDKLKKYADNIAFPMWSL